MLRSKHNNEESRGNGTRDAILAKKKLDCVLRLLRRLYIKRVTVHIEQYVVLNDNRTVLKV